MQPLRPWQAITSWLTDRAPHLCPAESERAASAAVAFHAHEAKCGRLSQFAKHWPPNLWANPWPSPKAGCSPARPPTSNCSSEPHTRLWRRGCDSGNLPEPPPPGAETRGLNLRVREVPPTTPLPGQYLPLGALQCLPRSLFDKRLRPWAGELPDHPVHGFGDFVGSVAREIVGQCFRVELAAGFPRSLGMELCRVKKRVWQGDCGFHTTSITAETPHVKHAACRER